MGGEKRERRLPGWRSGVRDGRRGERVVNVLQRRGGGEMPVLAWLSGSGIWGVGGYVYRGVYLSGLAKSGRVKRVRDCIVVSLRCALSVDGVMVV